MSQSTDTNPTNSDPSKSATAELSKVDLFNFKRNLKSAFEDYGELEDPLKEKLLDYLTEGKDPSCLLEIKVALAAPKKPFFTIKHNTLSVPGGKRLASIFHQHPVPAGYFFRLAEWLMLHPSITGGAGPNSPKQGDPRLPDWFNTLAVVHQTVLGYFYGKQSQLHLLPMSERLSVEQLTALVSVLIEAESDYTSIGRLLVTAADVTQFFEQRSGDFCKALKAATAACAESTLHILHDRKFKSAAILPTIVELLVSGGKKVRGVAAQIVAQNLEAARPLLSEKLKTGSAAERTSAAEALAELYGQAAMEELRGALESEKGARLRQTLEGLLERIRGATGGDNTVIDSAIELPPIELPPDPTPLPTGFRESLAKLFDKAHAKFEEQYQKELAQYNSDQKPTWMRKPRAPSPVESSLQDELCRYLEGNRKEIKAQVHEFRQSLASAPIDSWCDSKQLHLLHVLRLMHAAGFIQIHHNTLHVHPQMLLAHRLTQDPPYGLREIDAALTRVLGKPNLLMPTFLGYLRPTFDLEDEAIWPLFYEHADGLRAAIMGQTLERNDYYAAERRRNAIAVAAMLPALPKSIENALWSIALGEAKTDRPQARRALSKVAGRLERGLAAIADGKQLIRIAGAELLAELGDPVAVEPLKKALKEEKQEAVKGSFLHAIELLGGDVEEFLGRRKQLLDAKKGLEKKMPKGMEWFPLDSLPTVRWAEDDKAVAPEIVRWWVIQSVQFKLPSCGALLRRSMMMCRPDDAAALAKFVLSAWIGYDTQVPNPSDTLAAATERARKEYQSNKWLRDYYATEELYRDTIMQQMQGQFLNSATSEKGALAIVSAGGDKHCVRMIEKYIRTYHGHRLAQSKALLEVLGWIDEPLAIQVLLSLGNRFRTAAIRKRAAEMVKELAERKGWTMEQLADRTIPDAGFIQAKDEEGRPIGKRAELVLDYGARKFTVIMNDDLEPVISREDGKEVKALPAAAKDDDPELVKAAKAEFTAAKKTVKDVVKLLAEQLYEAVCSQRTWVAGEWKSFLATHPIAGALCRRVVWRAYPEDNPDAAICFRPLEDGSLTDVDDNSVDLTDNHVVTVAHSSLMSSDEEQGWINHLKDYEVPRLFVQFGRNTYRLQAADKDKLDIDAFQGHMLTTFQLRNKATKLGWQRGSPQDGGSFGDYFKPFRSSGITAMLEFTGSYVPEQEIPAGLRTLYFVAIQGNQEESSMWNPTKIKLSKVPAILISECYNDVREIAAEGSGFDPEWEKKGLW